MKGTSTNLSPDDETEDLNSKKSVSPLPQTQSNIDALKVFNCVPAARQESIHIQLDNSYTIFLGMYS